MCQVCGRSSGAIGATLCLFCWEAVKRSYKEVSVAIGLPIGEFSVP